MRPAYGKSFIIEDTEDFSAYQKMGLEIPAEAMKGVGSTGVIYDVNQGNIFVRIIRLLVHNVYETRFKKGQRVIFDRFVADDIANIKDDNGKEIERLKCVHSDCILGTLD